MNLYAIRALYLFEMQRTFRTIWQSIVSPVISTSLYFVVFGAAIGGRMAQIDGVDYAAFIVPGLIMMSVLTQSIMNDHPYHRSAVRAVRGGPSRLDGSFPDADGGDLLDARLHHRHLGDGI